VHPPPGLSASLTSIVRPRAGWQLCGIAILFPALPLAVPRVLERRLFLGQRVAGAGEFQRDAPAAATVQEREAYAVFLLQVLTRRGVMSN
jgi:hypothetical protein